MPIIIDGWNLIRSEASEIDDDESDSVESAKRSISYLEAFQEFHKDPIIVVFDSTNEFIDTGYKNTPSLTIIPARNADNYIKRYIDKFPERQRRNLRVVSSDKEVFYYAKSAYATPLTSEDFWRKLKSDRSRPRSCQVKS